MTLKWPINAAVKTAICAFFTLGLAFGLDSLSSIGKNLIETSPRAPENRKETEWKISISPRIQYYLSAGRAKGQCDAYLNTSKIASTKASNGALQSLMLGVSVYSSEENSTVYVRCSEQEGFKNGLADTPIILPYRAGKILEIYRSIIYLFLGPILGLYLLIECLSPFSETPESSRVLKPMVRYSIATFAIVSFLYTLSLARVPRLFLENYSATCLHIFLRSLISLSFIEIVYRFHKRNLIITISYLLLITSDLFIALLFRHQPNVVVEYYKWHHPFFAASTLYVWVCLIRGSFYSRAVDWLQIVTGVWAITQAADAVSNFFDSGTYKSPMVIVLVTAGLVVLRRKEIWTAARIELAIRRILKAMSSNSGMESLLSDTATAVFEETSFKRFSIYLDHYCLGKSDQPHRRFERVSEFGYMKSTKMDSEIVFDEDRGVVMAEALKSGLVIFRQARDGCWYCVVPIGKLGCLNLSNDTPTGIALAHDSYEVVLRLRTVIDSLADKLLADTIRRNSYLERIKGLRGCGEWSVTLGAVFLDVVDFSATVKKYKLLNSGRDNYGRFVTAKYLPALIKAVGTFAQLEKSVGDLLYLVVLPDLLPDGETIETSIIKALTLLAKFIAIDGARICNEAGFPAIRLRLGAYVGEGTIICDEFHVRTVGDCVNYASRLLENAPTGTFLVSEKIFPLFPKNEFRSIGTKEVLENKDYLIAKIVSFETVDEHAA